MTQPTHSREAIQAAYNALSDVAAAIPGFPNLDAIAKVLPPIPEPERPRITPARELVVNILHQTQGRGLTTPAADLEWGIKAARAEIIALLEWKMKDCVHKTYPGQRCETIRDIIKELREADA